MNGLSCLWSSGVRRTWRVNMKFNNEMGGVNLTSLYDPACATPTGCGRGNRSQCRDTCGAGYDRNASSLECVHTCSPGACVIEGVCVIYDGRCPDSTQNLITTAVIIALIVIASCITFCAVILTAILAALACIARYRRKKKVVNEHVPDVVKNYR